MLSYFSKLFSAKAKADATIAATAADGVAVVEGAVTAPATDVAPITTTTTPPESSPSRPPPIVTATTTSQPPPMTTALISSKSPTIIKSPLVSGIVNFFIPGLGDVALSKCTGTKKALIIGINYIGQKRELNGSINDAMDMRAFIMEHYGFKEENIVTLVDLPDTPPERLPTRENMIRAMRWLVDGAKPSDSLFLHFSGHGNQTPDLDGDEYPEMFDQIILPLDAKTAGAIMDDAITAYLPYMTVGSAQVARGTSSPRMPLDELL